MRLSMVLAILKFYDIIFYKTVQNKGRKDSMRHLKLGFIGFGLIGGSIARVLKKKKADVDICVYSRRKNPDLETGVKEGIIDNLVYQIDENFANCDVIFLCAPVLKNPAYLSLLKDIIKPDCIITDVGSVKGNICKEAEKYGLSAQFIGGHPMAGSEKTGYANSTDILLENAYYLLTPTVATPTENIVLIQNLISYTGANCVILTPEEHDKITAAISHVPHIIAVSLVNLVRENDNEEENMKSFAAGGFKDITRIASSSPDMWQDICLANADSINYFLEYYENQIHHFRDAIASKDTKKIYDAFELAGDYRNSIPSKKSSIISRTYDLFINIDDRTGAIAAIAAILSDNGISIKNIGIVHNREFADGVLRLELYNEKDADLSRHLLLQDNYTIVDRKYK